MVIVLLFLKINQIAVSRAADWISSGDLLGNEMYSKQNFDLMKEHAILSTVAPSNELKGFIEGAPKWPRYVLVLLFLLLNLRIQLVWQDITNKSQISIASLCSYTYQKFHSNRFN